MREAERKVILPVTLGGIIEFYEIYLYAYWTPILINSFYTSVFSFAESLIAGLIFVLVLLSRPLGGLIFGYLGDRIGRKFALVLSIGITSFSSFTAVFLSPSWGVYIVLYIGLIKFIQGIPLGGELPAAICLLAESASSERRRRYLCSYALIGPQIGQILSMAQCLLLETYYSHEFLVTWGWRISFIIAGLVGVIGVLLRNQLDESPSFKRMKENSQVLRNPIKEVFKNHKKRVLLAFFVSVFEVAGFFMLAFFLVDHFAKIFNISQNRSGVLNILFLVPIVFIQPIIGKISEKYGSKRLFILSAVTIVLVALPFYLSISHAWHRSSFVFLGVTILSLCIQFSLLPSLLADMFPPSVRFTGIGFSFNMCNSVIGSIAPILGVWLTQATGNLAFFVVIYPLAAIIFLCTLPFISAVSSFKTES